MLSDGYHDVPKGKVAMVVTLLEMAARPKLRSATLPEGVTIRQVTPNLDWYRDIFQRVGAFKWLWFGRLKLTDEQLHGILDDPEVQIFTLAKDGTDHALLELDFRKDAECELAYFGLTPQLIGTGAGRYLINQAITHAWDRPITRFHVHTCTLDSPQALNFYIRSGFEPTHQRIEIEDDPRLSGILPRAAGSHVPIIN